MIAALYGSDDAIPTVRFSFGKTTTTRLITAALGQRRLMEGFNTKGALAQRLMKMRPICRFGSKTPIQAATDTTANSANVRL